MGGGEGLSLILNLTAAGRRKLKNAGTLAWQFIVLWWL
jgi:hypothetical protein